MLFLAALLLLFLIAADHVCVCSFVTTTTSVNPPNSATSFLLLRQRSSSRLSNQGRGKSREDIRTITSDSKGLSTNEKRKMTKNKAKFKKKTKKKEEEEDAEEEENATTTSSSSSSCVHLLSLAHYKKRPHENAPRPKRLDELERQQQMSARLKQTWQWKDEVLGHGVDFFVPRPRTLKKLGQQLLLVTMPFVESTSTTTTTTTMECCILSNCARFEILFVSEKPISNHEFQRTVSQLVTIQVQHYQRYHRPFMTNRGLHGTGWDRPNLLTDKVNTTLTTTTTTTTSPSKGDKVHPLLLEWTHLTTQHDILYHLSLIAAGMASRPNQPEKYVPFRPYSSRDAHVMLQLKRSIPVIVRRHHATDNNSEDDDNRDGRNKRREEVQQQQQQQDNDGSTTTISIRSLLETAIRIGKACRNVDIVPEIKQLLQQQQATTKEEERIVRKAVHDKVIIPLMDKYNNDLIARRNIGNIQTLRNQVLNLAKDQEETVWLKEKLHGPTMKLRSQEEKNDGKQQQQQQQQESSFSAATDDDDIIVGDVFRDLLDRLEERRRQREEESRERKEYEGI